MSVGSLPERCENNVDTQIPTSAAWKSFALTIEDGGYTAEGVISCLQCKMIIEYNDNKIGRTHKCLAEGGRKWTLVPNRFEIIDKIKSEIAISIVNGVYRLKMNRRPTLRSTAWNLFALIVKKSGCLINGYYYCLKCKVVLKSLTKTNGLKFHKCFVEIRTQNTVHSLAIEEVESKLRSGIYTMKHKPSSDPIWDIFALILKDTGNCTVKGMICCRFCKSVFKWKDGDFNQHKCVESVQIREIIDSTKEKDLAVKINEDSGKRLCVETGQDEIVCRLKKPRANVREDLKIILSDKSNSIIKEHSQQSSSKECENRLHEFNDIHSNETIDIKEEEPRHFDIMNSAFNESYRRHITEEINETICLDSPNSWNESRDKDNDFKEYQQRRINHQGEYENLVQEFNEINSNETIEIKDEEEPRHFDLTKTAFNEIDETICLDSPNSWNEEYKDNVTKETTNIYMQWVIEDLTPLTKLEAASFHKMINYWLQLGASYGANVDMENTLPNARTLARHIKQRAKIKKSEIIFKINEIFKNIENLAISLDICSDNIIKKTFLFATLHLVENGEIFDICLGVKSMDFSQTSATIIRNKLANLLSNFGLNSLNDLVFVTEKDSDMMEEALDSCTHLKCCRYLFSKVLDAAIDRTVELRDLTKTCKVIMSYLKSTNQRNLRELGFEALGHAHYELFKSITLNWCIVNEILAVKKEILGVSDASTATLQFLVKFCQRFELIFKRLQETQSPTLCFVIPSIQRLQIMCAAKSNDFPEIKTFKTNMLKFIEEIWLANIGIWHKAACFLFPPANQMQESHLNEIKDFCLKQMKLLTLIPSENDSTNLTECVDITKNEADDMDFFFPNLFKNPDLQSTTANNAEEEINRYCREKILIDTSFNALQWWYNNSTKYPLLSRLALQVLSIPACTAKSKLILPVNEHFPIISTENLENISLLNSLRQK